MIFHRHQCRRNATPFHKGKHPAWRSTSGFALRRQVSRGWTSFPIPLLLICMVQARPELQPGQWSQENLTTCPKLSTGSSGVETEDLETIDESTEQDEKKRHMKTMGLPEIDPDALPSSVVGKYLILKCISVFLNVDFSSNNMGFEKGNYPYCPCGIQDCYGEAHDQNAADLGQVLG